MKHPSAYYLLLLYTIIVCKPHLPVVRDVLAHTFWAQAHIVEVHHHHGAAHLHYELKEAAKQDSTDTTTIKNSDSVPVHLLTQHQFDFTCYDSGVQRKQSAPCAVPTTFSKPHTPPPKA